MLGRLLLAAGMIALSAQAVGQGVLINEIQIRSEGFDFGFGQEAVELLLLEDFTPAELEALVTGDSDGNTQSKEGTLQVTDAASLLTGTSSSVFPAGTLIVIGGGGIPEDLDFDPIEDDWNLTLNTSGSHIVEAGNIPNYELPDVAWVGDSPTGSSISPQGWGINWDPTPGTLGQAANVTLFGVSSSFRTIAFTGNLVQATNPGSWNVNGTPSLGEPNGGLNDFFISQLRESSQLLAEGVPYQGRLDVAGAAAEGVYDLEFTLWDALESGAVVEGPIEIGDVAVDDGIFSVVLPFDPASFQSTDGRWLQISVRGGEETGPYTLLSPRERIQWTPRAFYARRAQFADFAWSTRGNFNTNEAFDYLGTGTDTPLNVRVNDQRALRVEPGSTANLIGGHPANSADAGVVGAAVGGGGEESNANRVTGNFGAIGGGIGNTAARSGVVAGGNANTAGFTGAVGGGVGNTASGGDGATVGGGFGNNATAENAVVSGGFANTASGSSSVVGGGSSNTATTSSDTVAGGRSNEADGPDAFVGGGSANQAIGTGATVAGGEGNAASARWATIAGGETNFASRDHAFVGGGDGNSAEGDASAIAGGQSNRAAARAFVGGGFSNRAAELESVVAGGSTNLVSGRGGFIGGGTENTVEAVHGVIGGGGPDPDGDERGNTVSDAFGVVGGGTGNTAGDGDSDLEDAAYATVSGGSTNFAGNLAAAVGGGMQNSATGRHATIPGGQLNRASGDYSMAAGLRAEAEHNGAFVWADAQNAPFRSSDRNQFLVRADGGVGINTDSPSATLDVAGNVEASGSYTYSTPRTYYKMIPAIEFQPRSENEEGLEVIWYGGEMAYFKSGDNELKVARFVADIQLPQGAILERMDYFYRDRIGEIPLVGDPNMGFEIDVFQLDPRDGSTVSIFSTTYVTEDVEEGSVSASFFDPSAAPIIDNRNYQYHILVNDLVMLSTSDPNSRPHAFLGARVTYTMDEVAP